MNRLIGIICMMLALVAVTSSCIDDEVSASPSMQPEFSVDTLRMGTVFTGECTRTFSFKVYNPHSKSIVISRIAFAAGNDVFRMNVDGMSGREFADVAIRPADSIFVFVEATIPEGGVAAPFEVVDRIEFTTHGCTESVVVKAMGQDVVRMKGVEIVSDTSWDGLMPRVVLDSLVVGEGATLRLGPGSQLLFHDKAFMRVRGTLLSAGTAQLPVTLAGDRTGNVVSDISFDLMSSQWGGVELESSSVGNELAYTVMKNSSWGLRAEGCDLKLVNCRLRNSGADALTLINAEATAVGCEIADAALSPLRIEGEGNHVFNHCTFANYYLFSPIGCATVHIENPAATSAVFSNCILYGLGAELSPESLDGTEVTMARCLFRSSGTDDANFILCLWDTDPQYYTARQEYIFDYRLQPGSPAIGAADPALDTLAPATDFYGTPRPPVPNLGAYN